LSWRRVLSTGGASGAWFGLFVGLLLFFYSQDNAVFRIAIGVAIGVVFGIVFAAVGYGFSHGRRDFTSASQLVAGRYDVLCQPRNAEKARDLIATLALRAQPGQL
jgi:hypothetical protein